VLGIKSSYLYSVQQNDIIILTLRGLYYYFLRTLLCDHVAKGLLNRHISWTCSIQV